MEKQRWEESEKRREEKRSEEKRREEKKREDAGAPKARKKSRNTVFFRGSGGSASRVPKAAGAEPDCTPLWREVHFEVKIRTTPAVRNTFGSGDAETVQALEVNM